MTFIRLLKEREDNMKKLRITGHILAVIQLVFSILAVILALATRFVPVGFGALGALILIMLDAFVVFMSLKRKKSIRIVAICLSSLLIILLAITSYYLYVTNKAIDDVTGVKTEVDEINVYVAKDDAVNSINEAVNQSYVFGLNNTDDQAHIMETVNSIQKDLGVTLAIKSYDTIFELTKAFQAGEVNALITNTGSIALLDSSEDFHDYSQNLKIIMEKKIEEKIEDKGKSGKIDDDHFCMYFSGIDTYGAVTIRSRSDVNIIGVVNNKTKQLLLISTPRDYYVPLADGKGHMDKLTHAGVYGIECSMNTLGDLYGVEMSNYLRLNFSGFKDIIDNLGGIDVESEYGFTADMLEGKYTFSQGTNHLNGDQALAFARERYAFRDGDRQRGRNQMRIIKATVEKLQSSDMLKNYSGVMEEMKGSFQTDMEKGDVGYLVQSTIEDSSWEVLTYSVGGNDSTKNCYSLGSEAYVMVPNEDDIDYAKTLINKIMSDEVVTQDEINVYLDNKDAEDLIDQSSQEQDMEAGEPE